MSRLYAATNSIRVSGSTPNAYAEIDDLTTLTWSMWLLQTGNGGGNRGRIINRGSGVITTEIYNSTNTNGRIVFEARRWTTTNGVWQLDTAIPQNQWVHLCITYDGGSTANNPLIFVDGSSAALTETSTPAGTFTVTENATIDIGQVAGTNRTWAGRIAEVALWNRVVSADEVLTIMDRSPIRAPAGLVLYVPIHGLHSPEPNYAPIAAKNPGTVAGTSLADHCPSGPAFVTTERIVVSEVGGAAEELTAELGTFTVAGTFNNTMVVGHPLLATLGTFAVAGIAATLVHGVVLTATLGTYAVAGLVATVNAGYNITAELGAFSVAGIAATLSKGIILTADLGTFAVTGLSITNVVGHPLVADLGTFTVAGISNTLTRGVVLTATLGTFAVAGINIANIVGHPLLADLATYAVTGFTATTSKSGGAEELIADLGTFSVAGLTAAVQAGYNITGTLGTFSVAGQAATLTRGIILTADTGAFAVAGLANTLVRGVFLTADAGSFSVVGLAAALTRGVVLSVDTGAFAVSGLTAATVRGIIFTADLGAFIVAGQTVVTTFTPSGTQQFGELLIPDLKVATGDIANLLIKLSDVDDFTVS